MRIRKLTYLAAFLSVVTLLTGCGGNPGSSQNISGGDLHDQIEVQEVRETDISKRFPEYFKYCFGEDATYTYLRTDEDDDSDYYELTYHDHTGALRTREYYTFPYGEEQAEDYPNAEEYYASEMEYLAQEELARIFEREFSQEVLGKYLNGHVGENGYWESETDHVIITRTVGVYIGQTMFLSPDDPVGQRLAHAHIEPGTGWQVCTADWKTLAADEEWYMLFRLRIPEDADAELYSEKLRQIMAEYQSCNEEPQSFSFILVQDDAESQHTVERISYVMDEEIDLAAMGKDYHVMKDHAEKLVQKHQND